MHFVRRILAFAIALVILALYYFSTRQFPSVHLPVAMSSSPIRLAIIEADSLQPKASAKYGGYGGLYTALLDNASESLNPPQELTSQFKITTHHVVNNINAYPSLDDIDAILISGSKHNAGDDDEWILKLVDFTRQALATNRIKVIGVCFGHQIVGRAENAKVGRSNTGWEIAVLDIDLTDKGREVFGIDAKTTAIQQMHKDIVHELPAGAILLASNAVCPVHSIYSPGKYITIQGHPEFTDEIVTEVVTVRHKSGLFNDEQAQDALKRAVLPHDGVATGRAFLKFLRQG